MDYSIKDNKDFVFSEQEIADFLKAKQDFIDGKTTARDWRDIEKELNNNYK